MEEHPGPPATMLVKALALCFPFRILWPQGLVSCGTFLSKLPGSFAKQRGNSVGERRYECENVHVHRVLLCFFCLAAQQSSGCLINTNAI